MSAPQMSFAAHFIVLHGLSVLVCAFVIGLYALWGFLSKTVAPKPQFSMRQLVHEHGGVEYALLSAAQAYRQMKYGDVGTFLDLLLEWSILFGAANMGRYVGRCVRGGHEPAKKK